MAPLLPVKKIYIDSQFMTSDSVSASNFKFQLPFSINLPKDCIFLIDDVCIPHSWYTIERGINDLLYIYIYQPSPATPFSAVFQIPPGLYNGNTFAAVLQSVLSSSPTPLTATYNSMTASLTISLPATTTSAV